MAFFDSNSKRCNWEAIASQLHLFGETHVLVKASPCKFFLVCYELGRSTASNFKKES